MSADRRAVGGIGVDLSGYVPRSNFSSGLQIVPGLGLSHRSPQPRRSAACWCIELRARILNGEIRSQDQGQGLEGAAAKRRAI